MRRLVVAALGVAALFSGAASAADPGRPANPPALSPRTAEAAEAWVDRYVVRDDYNLSGIAEDLAFLFDPASVRLDGPNLRAVVRGELFRPDRIQGTSQRSFRDTWAFDCAARTIKVLESDAFPQSNLQGRPVRLDMSKEGWSSAPEDDPQGHLLAQVCSVGSLLRSGVDMARAMPPPLADLSAAGTAAWMGRHAETGKDTLVYADKGIGVYVDPAAVTKSASGYPRLSVRSELSVLLEEPTTLWRSRRDELELDCANARYLGLRSEDYPGTTLLGAAVVREGDGAWTEAAAGTVTVKWIRQVCRALEKKPAPAPIPAPSATTEAAVADWIDAYINTNRFFVASTGAEGVLLYGVDDLERSQDGHVLATLRLERFKPDLFDGQTTRSSTWRMELDCKAEKDRVVGAVDYPENNLEGMGRPGGEAGWEKPSASSLGRGILRQVCSQADLIDEDGAEAMPTPLRGTSEAAIQAWISEHVRTDDYVVSGYNDVGAVLYSGKDMERTRQDYVRVWTRLEYFHPYPVDDQVMRSARTLVEIDCEEHRSRALASEIYAGSNLIGKRKDQTKAAAEWSYIAPNTSMSQVAHDVCELKDAADEDARDPAKALPASTGEQTL